MLRDKRFVVGCLVRMRQDCSGSRLGEIYKLKLSSSGTLAVTPDGKITRCSCEDKWEFVSNGHPSVYHLIKQHGL